MYVRFLSYGGHLVEGEVIDNEIDLLGRRNVVIQTNRGRESFCFLNSEAWKRARGEMPLFEFQGDRCVLRKRDRERR